MQKTVVRFTSVIPMIVIAGLLGTVSRSTTAEGETRSVQVQMRNVMYHFTARIAVHIRNLRGQVVPKHELPIFDDKSSFILRIDSAEIAITTDSLANALNSYVLAKPDAPLKAISIHINSHGLLDIKGKLRGKGDVPFETSGRLTTTTDGKIRLHAEKIKALHLPVKSVMDLVGLKIADLINTGKVPGLSADKNDLILNPSALLPPPHIAGQIVQVRLEQDKIVQVFGRGREANQLRAPFTNYMAYRGNQLRFGKLTMSDTDMVLIDMDPKDPFDFYLDHYKEQLVAGYTKETPQFGLHVFMRDYDKLQRATKESTAHPAQAK